MFQAPPLLLTLSLTILHFHFYNAIPVGEEQRHQAIHQNTHESPAYPSEAVDHQEASSLPRSQHEKREGNEESESTQMLPPATQAEGDELFRDISPKALAAVLLQALNSDGEEQTPSTFAEKTPPDDDKALKEEKENVLTESVKSRSQRLEKEEAIREDAKVGDEEDIESVKSLLQELESFQSPPKADQEIEQYTNPDNDDLEELKELLGIGGEIEEEKRGPIQPEPESPRKWAGEEESDNLAGVAQDLLLQYVLNGAESEGEQGEEENNQDEEGIEEADDYQGGDFVGGQRPMFEDEEDANNLEKRSNDDDDDDEVDPQTIDKLIELSSRLHLPADDVVDIITDVERRKRRRMKKKKARDDFLGRKERTRAPTQSWPDAPKPAYYPRRRLEQEPVWNKVQDPVWNKVPEPIWSKKKEPRWNKWAEPSWNKLQEPRWDKVQQPSWNKVQQPSWNKPSWNKVQQPSWNKVQQPSWNKVQQPSWNKVQQPSWKKMQEPNWKKMEDQGWNKVQDSNWNKVQDSNWNKVHDSSWSKLPESSWNEIEKPSWNKVQKSSWDNMEDSSWNKAKQPSWRKVMEPPPRRYRTRPSSFSNYMRPRAFQSPPRYYYKPPPPQIDDYFDEDKDRQEEMENYIERLLLTHPEVFQ
ncbi:neurosecretory protein VGF [Xenopus laevis]|uniref:Uncharacterized protein n=2 Tax=Xenopus laevis TaxID=8355 RepID=A0A974DG70_XENLA|nr:neurosecretory protein VGF [Xenopus laevis]OCT90555.1 hypothetical protein XELAEV_18019171mg [Xenopus laevis]